MNNDEYSEGGSKIERYEDQTPEFKDPDMSDSSIEEIDEHIRKWYSQPETVFHELISDTIHIDVHLVKPTRKRNYYTLVTSGMSDKPMQSPFGDDYRYAELMICLPPDWKMSEEDLKDEYNYWIIRWLKKLARFPHQYNSWIWETHTIPNGEPPEPFAPNTELCCFMLAPPVLAMPNFHTLEIRPDKIINFLSLIPIYKEEMQLKLDKGIDELYKKLDAIQITEVLDISRKNTCK